MNNKIFDYWNILKKNIEKEEKKFPLKEREIWFANVWKNIWTEQNWKWKQFLRPVLIQKILTWKSFIWIPLTSKVREWSFFYNFEFFDEKIKNKKNNSAILSQIKSFDKNRLVHKIWEIDRENFVNLKKKLWKLLRI